MTKTELKALLHEFYCKYPDENQRLVINEILLKIVNFKRKRYI